MSNFSLTIEQIQALAAISRQGYTVVSVRPQLDPDDALTIRFSHRQRGDVVADLAFDGTVYPDSER